MNDETIVFNPAPLVMKTAAKGFLKQSIVMREIRTIIRNKDRRHQHTH
jgi:hypothetical protein